MKIIRLYLRIFIDTVNSLPFVFKLRFTVKHDGRIARGSPETRGNVAHVSRVQRSPANNR